jgi:copper transport protein
LVAQYAGLRAPAAADEPAELVSASAGGRGPSGPARGGDAGTRTAGDPPDDPPVRRLRRSVIVELAIAAAVLVATSILVQSTPARTAAADAAIDASSSGLVTLNSPLYSLQMDSTQSNGVTELHLYAFTPAGAPLKVVEWKVTASLPAQNLGPFPVPMTRITDAHAVGQTSLTVPGLWTFTITLRISDIDEATVTTTIPMS